MKTLPLRLLLSSLALATAFGCNCKGPTTTGNEPDYLATPQALSFEACPTLDESGQPVPDVFPARQTLVIENRANVAGGLKLSVSGNDAASFKVVEPAPDAIPANGSVEVEVEFSPGARGAQSAQLIIDDEYEGTDDLVVSLVGTGSTLPAQASVSTQVQKQDKSGFMQCDTDSPLRPDCTLDFPATQYDRSEVMEVKIRNLGCPTLKITGLRIESFRGDQQNFAIESPATAPSEATPILLSTADGTEELTVKIRFSPIDDGSGNDSRDATLVILSNDPATGDGTSQPSLLALSAMGVKPSIYTSPTYCDFSNPNDTCGEAVKVPDQATFRVSNDGNAPVLIKSVKFRSSGSKTGANGRFAISSDIEGQTIQPATSAQLKLSHQDQPLYVSDLLDIEAVLPGPPEMSAGIISVALYGGKKPCLTTEPLDTLSFENPSTRLSAKVVDIRNGADCGTLIVDEVSIDPNNFFTLLDPLVAPGTQIPGGGHAEVTVQYEQPTSGGMQLGTLRIRTNDSDFGPPQYKLVQLISDSPLDEVPVAVLSACTSEQIVSDPQCLNGPTSSMAVNLSQLADKIIHLSGARSTDDTTVADYRFKLLPPLPSGVTTAALDNYDVKISTPSTRLTLPSGVTGTYRIGLEVWDNRGQHSANTSVLVLNVYP